MTEHLARLDNLVQQQFDLLVRIVMLCFAFTALVFIGVTLQKEVGFEPVWIARALAEGHGYSFPLKWAWLCTPLCEQGREAGDHLVSAWADPFFTTLYAGLISVFGEETSRIIIRVLHLGFFCGAAVLTALTARRIAGPWAGLIALGFLLVATKHHATTINAAPIATFWISLIAYYLVRFGQDLNAKRAAVLGGLLGISALTWGSTIIFIPIIAVFLLIQGRFSKQSIIQAGIAGIIAATIISPWTLRNYAAFGEFVPVRNGVGQVAWIGTVGAAGTFDRDAANTQVPPPWSSNGPGEAIRGIIGRGGMQQLAQLEGWQEAVIDSDIGLSQEHLNEAIRDKWLFAKAKAFVFDRPVTAIQLAFFKVDAFIMRVKFPVPHTEFLSIAIGLLTYFGLIAGVLLTLRKTTLWPPALLAAGFMAPFAIITPYYYRYRQPIEPIISILLAVSIILVFRMVQDYRQSQIDSQPSDHQAA